MLVNRAESHTSGARFVGQPACWPKRWIKTEPPLTWLDFTRNFAFYQNPKTLSEPKHSLKKKQTLLWTKTIAERGNFICWPKRLLKKGDLYFYQNLCRKKTSRFWKPCKANQEQNWSHETKPIKTTANRNASQKPWSQFWRLDKNNLKLCRWKENLLNKKPNLKTCWLKTSLKLDLKKRRR